MSVFYVGWNNPRFPTARFGYLPDLEREPVKAPEPIFRPRPVDKEIDQLKAEFLHLQKKLAEHSNPQAKLATPAKGKIEYKDTVSSCLNL